MFLRFLFLCLADLVANLIGYAINPFLPAFADADGNLPARLRWFQTYDATLDGVGLDGGIEPRFVRATARLRDAAGAPRNGACRYLIRVCWLYRNNAYGFAYDVLGAVGPFDMDDWRGELYPPLTAGTPSDRYPAQGGWRWEVYRGAGGRRYFHFRLVKDRGNGKCHEVNVGWKLVAGAPRAQLVWRYTPFRAFETQPVE